MQRLTLLRELRAKGLFIPHSLSTERRIADRTSLMRAGSMDGQRARTEVLQRPA